MDSSQTLPLHRQHDSERSSSGSPHSYCQAYRYHSEGSSNHETKTKVDDTEEDRPFPKEIDLNQSFEEIIANLPGDFNNEEELVSSVVAAGKACTKDDPAVVFPFGPKANIDNGPAAANSPFAQGATQGRQSTT
jgi:hypothetical protein